MTVFFYALKRYFRKPSNIVFLFILPVAAVFLPEGEWLPIPLGYQYYGVLLLLISARLTSILLDDRANRIHLRMAAAPVTHFQYLFQNLLAYSLLLIVVTAVFVAAGVLYHGAGLPAPGLLFIVYTLCSITSIGFCLAWYSLFQNREAAFHILGGLIIIIAMLGGMMWPVEIMPEMLQRLVMLLPTYWMAEGVILAALDAPIRELILPLGMMGLFSTAFLLVGSRRRMA
ncbi:multidrug ABC transporter permease [Alteribacter lacisalsi]|uniref:Multidrug ABC transporter permease n=1 Tax=Alteribacter lacisalsi TaxID=2045244 RepID=A0A2W0H6F9_9BACI|nr:ABC transporter permease [Alteribacter lacisalsi]PYZ96707.1 multidrug ABC transporter permease [Alteribacter lacisalsi]